MTSTKDTTRQPAVKKRPEIQMTMAKSTNGQHNDRRESVALRSTAEMAHRKLLPWLTVRKWEWNDSFCPVSMGLHLPWGQSAEKRKKQLVFTQLLNDDKREGEEIDGGHRRRVLSALHWQHKRTHYSKCRCRAVVKTSSDQWKAILRPHLCVKYWREISSRAHAKTERRAIFVLFFKTKPYIWIVSDVQLFRVGYR